MAHVPVQHEDERVVSNEVCRVSGLDMKLNEDSCETHRNEDMISREMKSDAAQ